MSSVQSKDLFYLDCLQVLDRVGEFKKFFGAFQQNQSNDLQVKLEQMEQQSAYRTELNEFKNVGQFITEEKDSILFLQGIYTMQQQVIKGDIPAKLNFDPLYNLLQRREQASPKLKEKAAKICAIGVTSLCWLASQVNKKYVDANIKTAESFME